MRAASSGDLAMAHRSGSRLFGVVREGNQPANARPPSDRWETPEKVECRGTWPPIAGGNLLREAVPDRGQISLGDDRNR